MSKIIRSEPGSVLSQAVEYHGFVYLSGVIASDTSRDIKGQTADVLGQIDALLERHGTDKTRLLQATIWVKDGAPVRACVQAELAVPEALVEIMITACK
jgi:enamine deaminase RidA (YjgF/YER057c/UK114 family)